MIRRTNPLNSFNAYLILCILNETIFSYGANVSVFSFVPIFTLSECASYFFELYSTLDIRELFFWSLHMRELFFWSLDMQKWSMSNFLTSRVIFLICGVRENKFNLFRDVSLKFFYGYFETTFFNDQIW